MKPKPGRQLFIILLTCMDRHYAELTYAPRQYKYDLLCAAEKDAFHPLHKPVTRYGRASFTAERFPVTYRNARAHLEAIRAEHNCYEPRGFNRLPYEHHARTAVKLRARDDFKELYESYLAAGDLPAMAETRARMALVSAPSK